MEYAAAPFQKPHQPDRTCQEVPGAYGTPLVAVAMLCSNTATIMIAKATQHGCIDSLKRDAVRFQPDQQVSGRNSKAGDD